MYSGFITMAIRTTVTAMKQIKLEATSFPGFSPTRSLEQTRRREPWERGWVTGSADPRKKQKKKKKKKKKKKYSRRVRQKKFNWISRKITNKKHLSRRITNMEDHWIEDVNCNNGSCLCRLWSASPSSFESQAFFPVSVGSPLSTDACRHYVY